MSSPLWVVPDVVGDNLNLRRDAQGIFWTIRSRARLPAMSDEAGRGSVHGGRAARLMELLGLSEDELCTVLDADPLTLLSGQLEHRPELPILLSLLEETSERVAPAMLRSWVRTSGPAGRPIDALLRRDFAAFEDALGALADRGYVLRGGGDSPGAGGGGGGTGRGGAGTRGGGDDGGHV